MMIYILTLLLLLWNSTLPELVKFIITTIFALKFIYSAFEEDIEKHIEENNNK